MRVCSPDASPGDDSTSCPTAATSSLLPTPSRPPESYETFFHPDRADRRGGRRVDRRLCSAFSDCPTLDFALTNSPGCGFRVSDAAVGASSDVRPVADDRRIEMSLDLNLTQAVVMERRLALEQAFRTVGYGAACPPVSKSGRQRIRRRPATT